MPAPPHLSLCPPGNSGGKATGDVPVAPLDLDAAYRAYASYVAYIGIRIMGRDDEIDDLVQDVFVEACRGLRGLRDLGATKAWLGTVTVRVATRRLRMRKLKRLLGLGEPPPDMIWPGASPEECAAIAAVYRKLETVPAKYRAAWVLRVVEEEPLEHVARACGCSLATVKRWINTVQAVVAEKPPMEDGASDGQ